MFKLISSTLFLLGASVANQALAGPFDFSFHSIDHFGNRMGQTSLVDVDRDGDLDWISGSASGSGGGIWWWEYRGPDDWVRHSIGNGNTDVGGAAFDVNGDGWVDHLSGSVLLLNTGDPRNEPFDAYNVGTIHSHDTEFADVDGDGRLDVVANSDTRGLFWYKIPQNPTQKWSEHTIATREEHQVHGGPSPRAVGDIDGDGDNDVVTAGGWYENVDGAGTSWKPHLNINFGEKHQYGIAVRTWLADLDGDGDIDVIQSEADNPDGRVAWFENDGRGNWTMHLIKAAGDKQDFHALAVADFDNDGDLDVFAGGGPLTGGGDDNTRSYIWENRQNASSWTEHVVATKPCHEVEVADVDKDGDVDIVCKPWKLGDEHFYLQNLLNNGQGGSSNRTPVAEPKSEVIEAGDSETIRLSASDPDGDPLTFEVLSQPSQGIISGAAPDLVYTPKAGYTGPDSFTFRVSDGKKQSSPATVSLTVRDTTSPSKPNGLAASSTGPTQITLTWNESTDNVAVEGYTIFRNGTEIFETSDLEYVDSGLAPSTSYTYNVSAVDAAGNSSDQSASVSATTSGGGSSNTKPVASSSEVSVDVGQSLVITVQATDADGDELMFEVVDGPEHGTVSGSGPEFSYTPNAGFAGTDQFLFRASDGRAVSNNGKVSIDVVDTMPPGAPDGLTAEVRGSSRVDLTWNSSSDDVGVATYIVYRDDEQRSEVTGTRFTDATLKSETEYSYRVAAVDNAGNISDRSERITVVTETDVPGQYVMPLVAGWNLVSSLVVPEDPSLDAIFDEIAEFFLVKDEIGRAFVPDHGVDEIQQWDEGEAYFVFANDDVNVTFVGEPIEPSDTPISLTAGWNLAPFFLKTPLAAEDVVSPLGGAFVILKDDAGRIYYPSYGIDQVGVLQPGKGYFLYVNKQSTLSLTASSGKAGGILSSAQDVPIVPVSATFIVETPGYEDGDEIRVYDPSDRLLATGKVEEGVAVLAVPGDEPMTEDVSEGAQPNQRLRLVAHRNDTEEEVRIQRITDGISGTNLDQDLRYAADLVLIVQLEHLSTSNEDHPSEHVLTLGQNYPNPFVDETQIEFRLNEPSYVRLDVYSMTGRLISTLVDEHKERGSYRVSFDGYGLGSGMYLYRLEAEGKYHARLMTLMR